MPQFNGDGFVDLLLGQLATYNHLYYNDGHGNFPSAAVSTLPGVPAFDESPFHVAVGDVNGAFSQHAAAAAARVLRVDCDSRAV